MKAAAGHGQPSSSAPPQDAKKSEPGFTPSCRSVVGVLSPHDRESLPFQGRKDMFGRLNDWFVAPGAVPVQAVLGGGRRGKTRQAAELAASAWGPGRDAGFVRDTT